MGGSNQHFFSMKLALVLDVVLPQDGRRDGGSCDDFVNENTNYLAFAVYCS